MFKEAQIICNQPAWLLLDEVLYYFEEDVEGKKLQPFLNKRFISIPKSSEKTYFEKFVAPLIEKHAVYAEGFEIRTEKFEAIPILKLLHSDSEAPQLQLYFKYGDYIFPSGSDRRVTVRTEKRDNDYIFHRIKRSLSWEKNKINILQELGLSASGSIFMNVYNPVSRDKDSEDSPFSIINWLNEHHDELEIKGFLFEQTQGNKRYVIGRSKIDLEIRENNDWFDIHAVVHFGPYQIPFIDLKNHILNKIREFKLPSGEIAVIPEQWFAQYSNLLQFSEGSNQLKLKKHHIGLINDFSSSELAIVSMDRKLKKLANFEEIEEIDIPKAFHGILRPYQKAGYDWFHFLRKYNFGGCLADDMGLGKTVQTLALLQKVKEDNQEIGVHTTSLIIMPTSLVYNWMNEAKKFAPKLKIHAHTGTFRNKDIEIFSNYDVVITTYGITRVDIEILKTFFYEYIILDESQNIKNPASKSFKSVKTLKSKHKLILSGTPVENTVNDLWTQMSFINPGLLGSQSLFYTEFVIPIEKKKDEEKA